MIVVYFSSKTVGVILAHKKCEWLIKITWIQYYRICATISGKNLRYICHAIHGKNSIICKYLYITNFPSDTRLTGSLPIESSCHRCRKYIWNFSQLFEANTLKVGTRRDDTIRGKEWESRGETRRKNGTREKETLPPSSKNIRKGERRLLARASITRERADRTGGQLRGDLSFISS